jgi:hypothetical protein
MCQMRMLEREGQDCKRSANGKANVLETQKKTLRVHRFKCSSPLHHYNTLNLTLQNHTLKHLTQPLSLQPRLYRSHIPPILSLTMPLPHQIRNLSHILKRPLH